MSRAYKFTLTALDLTFEADRLRRDRHDLVGHWLDGHHRQVHDIPASLGNGRYASAPKHPTRKHLSDQNARLSGIGFHPLKADQRNSRSLAS